MAHKRKTGIVCLLMALLLAGCLGNAIESAGPGDGSWLIELQLSGGIAGLNRSITLVSNGQVQTVDRRVGTRTRRQASNALMVLATDSLMQRTKMAQQPGDTQILPGRCADCIVYRLKIVNKGDAYHVNLDTLTLARSPYKALVEAMEAR
ncbi:MAG: hypothetical protein OEZ10_00485 [Gammaproteobacteria bacterium]|nr:hypothetical protein [Gammaproteobacteria bacterium]